MVTTDPLVRVFSDRYECNCLTRPRRQAGVGDVFIRRVGRVSPSGDVSSWLAPAVHFPPVSEDEPLPDLAETLSDRVELQAGLDQLRRFLATSGSPDLVDWIAARYAIGRAHRLRLGFPGAYMDSIDADSLGLALDGREVRADRRTLVAGDDCFIAGGAVRSPSIRVLAEDARGRIVAPPAELLERLDAEPGVSAWPGAGTITYAGADALTIGLRLLPFQLREGRFALDAVRPVLAASDGLLDLEPRGEELAATGRS